MEDANAPSRPSPAYTFTSVTVAALAALTLCTIAGAQSTLITKSAPLADAYALSVFVFLLAPHLFVLALLASGFRRTGDALAVPVAILIGAWSALTALLHQGSPMPVVVLLQVLIFIVAIADLHVGRRAAFPPASPRARLLGLLAALVVGFVADRVAAAPIERELARRDSLTSQQRAAEVGAILPPSPHLPDSVRLQRTDWASYSVLGRVFGMAQCIEKFRGDSGGPYPRSLGELRAWSLRDTLSSYGCASKLTRSTRDTTLTFLAPDDGRIIRYTPPAGTVDPYRPAPFTLETEAIWDTTQHFRGQMGVRNFLLDTAGNVHFTDEHRRVTLRDPLRPRCDPPEDFREVAECAVSYAPRRRWGAYQLPFAGFMMVSEVKLGDEFSPMLQFDPVYAIDSVARVSVDWGDGATEEVPPTSERSYGANHDWNRTVRHVYRAPGSYSLAVTFTTRNGDAWKASRTVSVMAR